MDEVEALFQQVQSLSPEDRDRFLDELLKTFTPEELAQLANGVPESKKAEFIQRLANLNLSP